MVENQDIVQGAITKTKLSKNLRLDLTNLPQGTAGQIPIIQSDGNWGLVGLSGDISIAADGTTTVLNNAEITAADIDTAFNFIHDENGYIVRSPQREGQTTVYEVDNSTYVTEVVAAAHAEHAVTTKGTRKYTRTITWGTNDPDHVSFSGDVATVTHSLNTEFITVSVIDVSGRTTTSGARGFVDLDVICMVVSVDSQNITIEWDVADSGSTAQTGYDFKLTVIG